jgi:aminopeptidase YwaD
MGKTRIYITKPFENFNLSVNQEEARLSYHAPFWDADIPAVMVTETAFFRNPHYYQPTDTLETLDIEFIRKNVEAIAETLKTLLQKK